MCWCRGCVVRYRVEIKPGAEKELKRLSGRLIGRIGARMDALAANPRPPSCKKLQGL